MAKNTKISNEKKAMVLTEVLFVRISSDLRVRLNQRVEQERANYPGRTVSEADVVREILYEALLEPNP